jgi:hypothetical protein
VTVNGAGADDADFGRGIDHHMGISHNLRSHPAEDIQQNIDPV